MLDYAREKLDPKQKILIMEELAGRDINLNGGIKSICKKTKLKQELIGHLDGLKEFNPTDISKDVGWENPEERYIGSIRKVNEALKKY